MLDLGIGLGTIVLGSIAQLAGYRTMYAVCAASAAIGLFVFMIWVKGLLVNQVQEN